MNTRAGHYKTNLSGELAYTSFVPAPLPPCPPIIMTEELTNLLTRASAQLAKLENIAKRIPNVDIFISMYVLKEALMSSQIEGTQATLEDILDPMIPENTNRDVVDVINYNKAIYFAINLLKKMPLCNRLLRKTHSVLMSGVRGQEKYPGEFRKSQNWIGVPGSTLKNASYIPPCPDDMIKAMNDLELYINTDDNTNILIRAALIHYQFETIHPFLDGNGRIGRLLIILYLMQKNILSAPVLYISYFLKKYRYDYYKNLSNVRDNGSYETWIIFFIESLIESSNDAIITANLLSELHDKNYNYICSNFNASKNILHVLNYIEQKPIINIKNTASELGLSYNTVSNIINKLLKSKIIAQKNTGKRNRIFAYEDYLSILRNGTLPCNVKTNTE